MKNLKTLCTMLSRLHCTRGPLLEEHRFTPLLHLNGFVKILNILNTTFVFAANVR
jgi:hypothetical protein